MFLHVPVSSIENIALFDPSDLIPSVQSHFEPLSFLADGNPPSFRIHTPRTPFPNPDSPRHQGHYNVALSPKGLSGAPVVIQSSVASSED